MKILFKPVLLLLCLASLQSCSVYHSRPVSVDDAVDSNKRVKVVTNKNKTLEFREVRWEGEDLVGLTRVNSETARKLNGR